MARLAVVLFNLGGPDGPHAVEPFLFNLFYDPAIIRLPAALRWPIAKLVSRRRAPIAREIYRHLGGGSPLLANTEAQAAALQAALAALPCHAGPEGGSQTRVFIAMRYWHPQTAAAAAGVKAFAPDRVLLLPLYPQFSTTTTASSALAWRQASESIGLAAPTRLICCYPTEPGFIAALAELTAAGLADAARLSPGTKARLIFSAHGLPMKIVKAGDPYVEQARATCRAVAARLGLAAADWELGFQSRVGPVEWVGPATDTLIRQAAEARQPIVVVPVAFVSEHSETLVELDIEYRKLAVAQGATTYVRVPTVGTHPAFIAGLARLVAEALTDDAPATDQPAVVGFGACTGGACPNLAESARLAGPARPAEPAPGSRHEKLT